MSFRRLVVAGLSACVLAVPAAAASAQETGIGQGDRVLAQETGIGEPDSVECTGSVRVGVVDLDGAPVGGAVLMVGGQRVSGAGTVSADCGELTAALLVVPDGYAAAGPTEAPVRVRAGAVTSHTFTVDPVAVLGTQFEQPDPAAEPPAPETPAADPEPAPQAPAPEPADQGDAQTLPETGPAEAEPLLLAALVLALLGTLMVGLTPAPARRTADVPTSL